MFSMGISMRPLGLLLAASFLCLSPVTQTIVAQPAAAQSRVVEREVVRYVVRPGDTMSSIARSAGIALRELQFLNPGVDPRFLRVGQTIYLPADAPVSPLSVTLDDYRGRIDQEVALRGSGFEPGSRVQIMAGEGPYRLQVIGVARADRRGGVNVAVDLPEWARPGQQVFFGLQSRDGRARAVADAYQVIGRPARPERPALTVSGTLTRQGVECPTMRGDDGRTYSLAGDIRGFLPGDRVTVDGRIADMSICQQGTAIEVRRIAPSR
jgi:LysM repeat protein